MKTCWLVMCEKGDAVFLADRMQRALDYAAEHSGVLIKMYGQQHGEALADSGDIRPARTIIVEGNQQLHAHTSDTGEVCEAS